MPDNSYIDGLDTAKISDKIVIYEKAVQVGETVTFFGYGCDNLKGDSQQANIKRFGQGSVSNVPDNKSYYFSQGKAIACYGDSGGATFLGDSNRNILVGVISGAAENYAATRHARIDNKINSWIKSHIETPIIDSHSSKVFVNLSSFKVYGYKLSAVGVDNIPPVFTFAWAGGSTHLPLATTCPTRKPKEAPYVCVDTGSLRSIPLRTVGDLTVSREVLVNGEKTRVTSQGIVPIKLCIASAPC
jgi:hypothetical protein